MLTRPTRPTSRPRWAAWRDRSSTLQGLLTLLYRQGSDHRAHPEPCARAGARDFGQCHRTRPDLGSREPQSRGECQGYRSNTARPLGRCRRNRQSGAVPHRNGLCHRRVHPRRWRTASLLRTGVFNHGRARSHYLR